MGERFASDNVLEHLRQKIRTQMNELSDEMTGGACRDFAGYTAMCGQIHGLALAEREILDLSQEIEDD